MTVTPKELNTNICTLQDVIPALQAQNEINNLFFEIINGGGVTDTYKVAVNGLDVAPDYLHAKINHAGTAPDSNAVRVNSVTFSDTVESFYWQPDDINNFGAAANMYLAVVSGVLTWVEIDASVDNNTVLVTGGDSTASFLHDAFYNAYAGNGAYVAGADLIVGTQTVGIGGTNQTEQLFVDVSAIAGWAGTGDFFLGMHNNAVSWMSFSDVISGGGGYGAGYAIVIASAVIHFDPTEITGFAPAFQMYMHFDDATTKFDPLWQTVDDYDETKQRYLQTNGSGGFRWTTGPADGASGTFMCTLSSAISGASTSSMNVNVGTVYSTTAGGGFTSVGLRKIWNPFKSAMPQTAGGATVQYTCAKTYSDNADHTNDEFTITGVDPEYILAALFGYGAGKSLYTDGSAVTDMKWGGTQCS